MTRRCVLVLGAGGHCKVVLDVLGAAGCHPIGILDPNPPSSSILGVPLLGGDQEAPRLLEQGCRHAFVAIGANQVRHRKGLWLRDLGFDIVTAVHPTATVSPSATIGAGTIVMPHAVVNADAKVGAFVIVNTCAIVEHDCVVGDAAHVAPGSVIGGNVTLGQEVLFGIGAVARPLIRVGDKTVVGAGSVLVGDIGPGLTVAGVPARRLPLVFRSGVS